MSWFRFKPLRVLSISHAHDIHGAYPRRIVTDRGTYARTRSFGDWSHVDEQRDTTRREGVALRAICRDWRTSRDLAAEAEEAAQ